MNILMLSRILVMLFVLLLAAPVSSAEYAGKVIGITDGDTLTLLTPDKQQIKVRLAEIDTPESGQPFGSKAKEALSALAFGRQARVAVVDRDRYGRIVGRVYVGDTDVNAPWCAKEPPGCIASTPAIRPSWFWKRRHAKPVAGFGRCRKRRSPRLGSGGRLVVGRCSSRLPDPRWQIAARSAAAASATASR